MRLFSALNKQFSRLDGGLIWTELCELFRMAWPSVLTYVFQYALGLINIIFVGHLGASQLAAASLAISFINVLGISLGTGFCSALDTLGAQAYGAGNYRLVGLLTQRGAVIMVVLYIPVMGLCFFSEQVLLAMKQDPTLSRMAADYIRVVCLGLLPLYWFELTKRFITAQGITRPCLYVSAVVVCISVLLNYLFIHVLGWGLHGSAVACSLSYLLLCVGLIGYIRFRKLYDACWMPLSMQVFRGWKSFLKMGIPGAAMVLCEWMAFECISFLAGWIGTNELAVTSIVQNTLALFFMLPLGFSIAGSTRVGNSLGAGRGNDARFSACVTVIICLMTSVVLATSLLAFRNFWGYLFTSDIQVVAYLSAILPLIAIVHLMDTSQGVCAAILRGCGRQKIGAFVNLAGYYFVGIPLGFLFAFRFDMGLVGLWSGLLVGLFVSVCLYFWTLASTDWDYYSQIAVEMASKDDWDGKKGKGKDFDELISPVDHAVVEIEMMPIPSMDFTVTLPDVILDPLPIHESVYVQDGEIVDGEVSLAAVDPAEIVDGLVVLEAPPEGPSESGADLHSSQMDAYAREHEESIIFEAPPEFPMDSGADVSGDPLLSEAQDPDAIYL